MEYFAKRVIPCLDVDNCRVVKGVNFVGLRDAGDPIEVAKRYNQEEQMRLPFLILELLMRGEIPLLMLLKRWQKRFLSH